MVGKEAGVHEREGPNMVCAVLMMNDRDTFLKDYETQLSTRSTLMWQVMCCQPTSLRLGWRSLSSLELDDIPFRWVGVCALRDKVAKSNPSKPPFIQVLCS